MPSPSDPHPDAFTRYTVVFSGRVQGVGFRFTVQNLAAEHDVSGWVRNEPGGAVCVVAEGRRGELDRFVASIEQAMRRYIAEKQITVAPAAREFSGFSIRY
jgi:acylphosphatase